MTRKVYENYLLMHLLIFHLLNAQGSGQGGKRKYAPIKTCCVIIILPDLTFTSESHTSKLPIYCECFEYHRITELK